MRHPLLLALLGSLAPGLLSACALLSKSEPMAPRYFTPEITASGSTPLAPGTDTRRLRLGAVESGSQLRERMMYRSAAQEFGYYADRRWTERPEAYLRRGLVRVLFEERGLFRVDSGPAPTLDAELVAFEVLRSPQPKVRVQVVIAFTDARSGRLSRTVTVDQPVGSSVTTTDDAAAEVEALGRALQSCLTQVAEIVVARLEAGYQTTSN
jgi:cholesterol transport system auxiliary component